MGKELQILLILLLWLKRWTVAEEATCPRICSCSKSRDGQIPPYNKYSCSLNTNFSLSMLQPLLPPDLTSFKLTQSLLRSFSDINTLVLLEELDLSSNDFTHVMPMNNYPDFRRVTRLILARNHISELRRDEFVIFPQLEYLDLSYNQISSMTEETFKVPGLKKLILHHNLIKEIPDRLFRYIANLEILDLSHNVMEKLGERGFFFLRSMRHLNLSSNSLVNIDNNAFMDSKQLVSLDLSFNDLDQLPQDPGLNKLRSLNFDGNPLIATDQLFYFPNLERLSLSHMPQFKMILAESFVNMLELRELLLRHNPVFSYFSPQAFSPNDEMGGGSKLVSIDLRFSNLSILPKRVASLNSLQKIWLKGNPVRCQCLRSLPVILEKISDIRDDVCANKVLSSNCQPLLYPPQEKLPVVAHLGVSLRLYCAALERSNSVNITWFLPSNISAEKSNMSLVTTPEFIKLDYVNDDDCGTYRCIAIHNGKPVASRSFSVTVATPQILLKTFMVTDRYVTVEWNRSHHDDLNGFFIRCKLTNGQVWVHGPSLALLQNSYTFTRLKPATNYTICVYFQPRHTTMFENCVNVLTLDYLVAPIGITLNYTLIALLTGLISTSCGICLFRCIYQRFHVWQREKMHSRMQESISAQGFFTSFDSLASSAVAVTYENPHRHDAMESDPEEAVGLVDRKPRIHTTVAIVENEIPGPSSCTSPA